jgi:electron transfer flavoprotein beta subunit
VVNIAVAIKHVPADDDVRVSKKTGQPVVDLTEGRMNPLGRRALETGLRLSKQDPASEVTAVSLGPEEAEPTVREALAMGADRGVLVADPLLEESTGLATAKALASTVRSLGDIDVVIAGARTTDRFAGHVGPAMAALLGVSIATHARSAGIDVEDLLVEKQRRDGTVTRLQVPTPCLVSVGPQSPDPRHATTWGVHAAFAQDALERWSIADLDVSPDELGPGAAATTQENVEPVAEKERETEIFDGEAEDTAESLQRRLNSRGLLR